eukprot:1778722-Rhodomonas_salina.4
MAKATGIHEHWGREWSLWSTGPHDLNCSAQLTSVVQRYIAQQNENEWYQYVNPVSRLLTPFLHFTEAQQYHNGNDVLAATDGSVKHSKELMGAGFSFTYTNDNVHQGSRCCAVGGDLLSLCAEAAELDLLLDNTASDCKL